MKSKIIGVERAGYHLNAQIYGEGEPLLMIHGLSRSGQSWQIGGFIDHFSQSYQCICVDVLGHGESDDCVDIKRYHPFELAKDMVVVLDALNIKSTHCLGYSMGAGIAFALSVVAPERLKSVVAGGFSPDGNNDVNQKVIDTLLEGYNIAIEKGNIAYVEYLNHVSPLDNEEQQAILAIESRCFLNYRAALNGFLNTKIDILECFNQLSAAKMLYVGSEDEYFPGLLSGDWQRFNVDKILIVDGARHTMTDAHRQEVVESIDAFLSEVAS